MPSPSRSAAMLPATAPGGGGGTAATSSCLAQAVSTIAPIPASMIVLKRIAVFLSKVHGIARHRPAPQPPGCGCCAVTVQDLAPDRSDEDTSELQSLMRIAYAVFCLKKQRSNIVIRTYISRRLTN